MATLKSLDTGVTCASGGIVARSQEYQLKDGVLGTI